MKKLQTVKHSYMAPAMHIFHVSPMQLIATSGDPVVRTTSERVDTDTEALVKGNTNTSVWSEEW